MKEISKSEALNLHKEVCKNLSYLIERRKALPNNRAIESAIELTVISRRKLADILNRE